MVGIHYRMDSRLGIIHFTRPIHPGDSLMVIYRIYPFPLVAEYYHRELTKMSVKDTTVGSDKMVTTLTRSRLWEDIDGYSSNLEKSGSIVRGIEIGTNRDLSLNSGLNLQLSGYITPNVQVVAALTDESTPIQPEGNTQTLREVDKVFVKIKSPYLGGTLGDFNLSYQNSNFGNVNRKLQGINAYGEFGKYHQQLTYATLRGNYHTNQFLGQEGNQGPYQLTGQNGEREIIVLAGTEKVYFNGILQTRGENNHYVIDYSLGQIIFTNNLLITGEDRIEVDFEYTNNFQRYGKNFVGFSSQRQKTGQGLSYDVRLFREWDDTEYLLEDSSPLTTEEIEILKGAGNDPTRASSSGVDSVGSGNGFYTRRDTLLGGVSYKYYLYRGPGNGTYNVRFSSVGRGNGSYVRERLGVYRFVGPGFGEYLPIILIPLPADKKLGNIRTTYQYGKNLSLQGEWGISNYDRNVYSPIDDQNASGNAFTLGAGYYNDATRMFGNSVGLINWQSKWKRQEKEFSPMDRQFQPEFNYRWNLKQAGLLTDENMFESTLLYSPVSSVQLAVDGGIIERGPAVSSRRGRGELFLTDSSLVKSNIFFERVTSEEEMRSSGWDRSGGMLGKMFGILYPYLGYNQEDRKVNSGDSSLTGFFFERVELGMKIASLFRLRWDISSRVRDDYLYDPHIFDQRRKLSRSFTHQLQGDLTDFKNWQGRLSFVYRTKNYETYFEQLPVDSIPYYQPDPQFQDTSWVDNKSHLGRVELQYTNTSRTVDSRWQYRIASELQVLQEKIFLLVDQGRGNYRYDSQLQEYVPDQQGDYLLVIIPTGQFESVTNVEASWQLRYRPRADARSGKSLGKIFRNISFFSSLKVDERSRESDIWQLYLLNFQKFHNTQTTLRGTYTIDQDIYFFERNPNYGITLRSRYRDNLSNEFVDLGFNETRRNWDRSISWRQSLVPRKLTQELEYQQSIIYRSVAAIASRNRDIFGHSGAFTLNYRPVYAWQIQNRLEAGIQDDRAEVNQLRVVYFEFRPQVNYAIAGKARALVNLTLLQVQVLENPFDRPVPFEMAKGKREGWSFLGNFRFEYFISGNVTTTLNFTARRDAGALRTIYLGQAEVRAFF